MIYRIVGMIKNRPYSMDDQQTGKHFEGVSSRLYLSGCHTGETSENMSHGGVFEGYETTYIKFPKNQNIDDFKIGDTIQFFYNKYRQIDQVIKVPYKES